MNARQKLLVAVIALEAALITLKFVQATPLPKMDWRSVEPATMRDIQARESVLSPDLAESWFELGETYRTFGFFPEAEFCHRQAVRLSPNRPVMIYTLAVTVDLMGRTAEAMEGYREVLGLLEANEGIATQPYDPIVLANYCWLRIGEDYLRQTNSVAAEKALRTAELVPRARLLLARTLYRSGRAAEASELMDEPLRQFPGFMDFAQMKSWSEAEQGHAANARNFDHLALRCDQRPPLYDLTYPGIRARREKFGSLPWYQESLRLAAAGDTGRARDLAQRAVDSMWNEEFALHLAEMELKLGHAPVAIQLLERSLFHTGGKAAGFVLYGEALLQTGETNKARAAWVLADRFDPDSAANQRMADGYRKLGDANDAQRESGLSQYQAGKSFWLKNDLASAATRFEAASRLKPDHSATWFYLGEIRRLQGDKPAAETAYRRCLAVNPDHGRALSGLAQLGP